MPICNIIDRRTNKYDVNVMAIYEDSWHDNSCPNSTRFKDTGDGVSYLGIGETTVDHAIQYARQRWPTQALTLFLYDLGVNNYVDHKTIKLEDNLYKLEPK